MKNLLVFSGFLALFLSACSPAQNSSSSAQLMISQESASALSLISGSGEFGSVEGSPIKILLVKNEGDATSSSLAPAITGTNADKFSLVVSYCVGTLAPGKQCQLRVRFNGLGSIPGEYSASLNVGSLVIPLSAEVSAPAENSLSLLVQDGGNPVVGSLNYGTLTSRNLVNKILKITNTAAEATGPLAVELTDSSLQLASNTCGPSLNPGKSCQVRLILSPSSLPSGALASALRIKKVGASESGGGSVDENTIFLTHADGDLTDLSTSELSLTNNNVGFVAGKFGQGLDFSPAGAELVFPEGYNFGSTDVLIDVWVKHDPSGNSRQVLFSQTNATRDEIVGGSPGWMMSIVDGNRLEFVTNQLFHGFPTIREQAVNFNDGQWHHIALQRDTTLNYIMFYADGQTAGVFYPPNSSGNNMFISGTRLRVGMSGAVNPNTERFTGLMDEIRISNIDRYDYYDGNFNQSNNPEHNTTYVVPTEPYGGDGIVRNIEIALNANIQVPAATGADQGVDLNFYVNNVLSESLTDSLAEGEGLNQIFVVKNEGTNTSAPLTLSLGGANADKFQLVSNNCQNKILAPGKLCSVRVILAAGQSAGTYQAVLNIGDQSYPVSMTVAGAPPSPAEGVVLLAHFDENLTDASGKNKVLTHHLGAAYTTGKFSESVMVGESAPAIDVAPNDPDFKFGTGDFTIDLWINVTGSGGYNHFVGHGNSGLGGWDLYSSYGSLVLNNWTGPNAKSFSVPNTIVSPYTWYHVAITRHQGNVHLYVDGVAYDAGSFPEFDEADENYYFHIGGYTQGSLNWNMGGNIDEVRVIKGTDIYGGQSFTPPTAPYSAVN